MVPLHGGGLLNNAILPSGLLRELQRTELGEISSFVLEPNFEPEIRNAAITRKVEPIVWYRSRRALAYAAVFMWVVEAARHYHPYATIVTNDAAYEAGVSLSYMPGQAGNLDPLNLKGYRIAWANQYLDRLGVFRRNPKAQTMILRLGWECIDGFLEGLLGHYQMPISYFLLLSKEDIPLERTAGKIENAESHSQCLADLASLHGALSYVHELPSFLLLTIDRDIKELLRSGLSARH
jgi:hypothetical protein